MCVVVRSVDFTMFGGSIGCDITSLLKVGSIWIMATSCGLPILLMVANGLSISSVPARRMLEADGEKIEGWLKGYHHLL